MPVTPVIGQLKQDGYKFETNQIYSSISSLGYRINPVLKTNKTSTLLSMVVYTLNLNT